MKYFLVASKQYQKSFKKMSRSGKLKNQRFDNLQYVINELKCGRKLENKYRDHQLKGELKRFRECHVKRNFLLKYEIKEKELILILVDVGSHSDLFD